MTKLNYISTRGGSPGEKYTFSDILLSGLAKDGGLYLPNKYPKISKEELAEWRILSYAELTLKILEKFCIDIPKDDLRSIVYRTYKASVYCNARHGENTTDITPLKILGEEGGTKVSLLELSNGPTLAFKDIAMQLLGNLFEYTLTKRGDTLNILGATSGDTGSAAEYAIRGKTNMRVFMLSPYKKVSTFQAAQMYSLEDSNIFNLAIEGVFDDCQDIVKIVSNDHIFKSIQKIGMVNSINWARIVAQIVYYFKGYFKATKNNSDYVSFAVPSGNFGNVYAGHIARMMGLPISKLIVATNENNVLDEFFRTGIYRVRSAENIYHTSSPSMDISKASNFERFIFDLVDSDAKRVTQMFHDVDKKNGFNLSTSSDFIRVKEFGFFSGHSSHHDRIATIRDVYIRYKTMIDTHTADGLKVAREYLEKGIPMIVLETAQPIKFSETIREAIGKEPDCPKEFCGIENRPQRFSLVKANVQAVKDFIILHTGL
ncbi:MAG: threonine synthase [Burkholderia sp.]|nr:threonine synthase [Burkholderia sp.]